MYKGNCISHAEFVKIQDKGGLRWDTMDLCQQDSDAYEKYALQNIPGYKPTGRGGRKLKHRRKSRRRNKSRRHRK